MVMRRIVVGSGIAAMTLFVVAQFLPLRSLVVNFGNSASDTDAHILFTTATTTGFAAPVTQASLDPWRLVVVVLAAGLLIAGLLPVVRRSAPGLVMVAVGAGILVAVSILVLSAPFPPGFGWAAFPPPGDSAELVDSSATVTDQFGVGFYLAVAAAVLAAVCLVAAVISAARPSSLHSDTAGHNSSGG